MNHRRHTILLALAACVLATTAWNAAWGQATPVDPAIKVEKLPKAAEAIEYVGPDTYILLDAEGRPQPMLGMGYEEFVAAWKKLEHVDGGEAQPRFTIEELHISGNAREANAELVIEFVVRSLAGGPLKVPLGLAEAILLEEPRIESLGGAESTPSANAATKSFVSYEHAAGGFVAWIDAPPDERRKVTLKMVRPLVRDGNQSSVELNLPRALVSRCVLDVSKPVVEATVTEGAVLMKESSAGSGTRLEVEGPSGNFRLSWSTAGAERPELATVMSATGAVAISIDGHSIRADARLTVRSYGGSFDHFRVRLPPGAQLIQESPKNATDTAPDYRILAGDPNTVDSGGAQIVTVELAEKQMGPIEVRLSTEQPLGLTSAEPDVELAGFEVLGAVRQFGDVAIAVADDWQLRWENGPYVRQVERADLAEPLRATQPTVAFQYDRQPWSLRAQVVGRPMVVHVTPEYTLHLARDEAQLHVRLSYQVPGARAFEFRVRLAGWELTSEPIESNGLVDRDRALVNRENVLVLPLTQASPRRAEVGFTLRKSLATGTSAIDLPLPVPEADTVATGELLVVADESLELLPDMASSRGLAPIPVANDETLPVTSGGEQQFRYRAYVRDARFAAERTIRARDVATEIDTRLAVNRQRLDATQEVAYHVRYQPLTELAIELPIGWTVVDDQIEIVPENSIGAPLIAAVVAEPATHGRPTRIARATLAQPRLGRFRVRAAYEVAQTTWASGVDANLFTLPQPAAARVGRQRVEISAGPNVAISLDSSADSQWRTDEDANPGSILSVVAEGVTAELPLVIAPVAQARPQAVVVERVWLQSWQAGNVIQDRAAIKFRTSDSSATLELPPLSTASEVEVLVDGTLARVTAQQEGRLVVPLAEVAAVSPGLSHSHTLELRYRRAAPMGLVTRLALTPPQLVGSSALCDVYWHVVLPGDRHVVNTPEQLHSVDPAQWLEVVLGRAATKTQAELEQWIGATSQLGPSERQNAYLYSGLAPVSIEVITAPRWLIVLAVSSVMLGLAGLWMYVPAARRAWIAMLLALVVAALALAFPMQAVLLGQASILGVLLAALALFLQRWTQSRTIFAPPAAAGSTNLRMRSSLRTDSYYAPLSSASPMPAPTPSTSGTPTAPLGIPEVDR